MNKADLRILKKGLARLGFALFTTALFAASVCGLITVAFIHGYRAVLIFIASIVMLLVAFLFLYAFGLGDVEVKGDAE